MDLEDEGGAELSQTSRESVIIFFVRKLKILDRFNQPLLRLW